MRVRRSTVAGGLALAIGLAAPVSASAGVSHTVMEGETLWALAATQPDLTPGAIAAANGLDEAAPLAAGTTIEIPTSDEATAMGDATAETAGAGAPAGSPTGGAYTVQPGDTLSAIAAAAGVSTDQLAAHNGLAADGIVIEGSVLELPAATAATATSDGSVAASTGPTATASSIGAAEIAQIAAEHGVPGDLAAAVAWQESGFSNGVVSPVGAAGVMQIMPSTWGWIQTALAGEALDPASPSDNVRAGVMFLGQLLAESGGDEVTAVASYYQGASSVASEGMFAETRQYVDNVMALRSQFGG